MTTTLVFVVAFCIVAVLVYMARYSGRVRIAELRLIDAPIDAVWTQVADFAHWDSWNPWLVHASAAHSTLSARTDGVASSYAWNSPRGGEGVLQHRRLTQHRAIEQSIRLKQPFAVRGRSRWKFVARGNQTEVSWEVRGRVNFSMRAFAQTVNGALTLDCRYGLDRLAQLLESPNAPRYALSFVGVLDVAPCRYVYRTYQGPIKGVSDAARRILAELQQQLSQRGIEPTGAPIAVYVETSIKLRTTKCHIGLPIGSADAGALPVREMVAHRAFQVRLQGSYSALEIAWYQAIQRMTLDAIRPDQRIAPFERYVVVAKTRNANDGVTELHIPVARPPPG